MRPAARAFVEGVGHDAAGAATATRRPDQRQRAPERDCRPEPGVLAEGVGRLQAAERRELAGRSVHPEGMHLDRGFPGRRCRHQRQFSAQRDPRPEGRTGLGGMPVAALRPLRAIVRKEVHGSGAVVLARGRNEQGVAVQRHRASEAGALGGRVGPEPRGLRPASLSVRTVHEDRPRAVLPRGRPDNGQIARGRERAAESIGRARHRRHAQPADLAPAAGRAPVDVDHAGKRSGARFTDQHLLAANGDAGAVLLALKAAGRRKGGHGHRRQSDDDRDEGGTEGVAEGLHGACLG